MKTIENMSQYPQESLAELLSALTMCEIIAHLKGSALQLSREQRTRKNLLIAHVVDHAPEERLKILCESASKKLQAKMAKLEAKRLSKKKCVKDKSHHHTVPHIEEGSESHLNEEYDPSRFLRLPTDEETKNLYGDYYRATSNTALKSEICAVCARECGFSDDGSPSNIDLTHVPNSNRLIPKKPHPAHKLFDGRLLDPSGVKSIDGRHILTVCRSCLPVDELKKSTKSPPRLALANQLWIGPVPWQLQILTFPEQLLVSLIFPRVFVFKLFPKRVGGVRDVSSLQRAMRGHVSSYELDSQGIMSMVEGKLMPRPPVILATLISVTFIGLGTLPKDWIHSTFRVRRQVVFDALSWLKQNNPTYYGDIEISTSRIQDLPGDDVPDEWHLGSFSVARFFRQLVFRCFARALQELRTGCPSSLHYHSRETVKRAGRGGEEITVFRFCHPLAMPTYLCHRWPCCRL